MSVELNETDSEFRGMRRSGRSRRSRSGRSSRTVSRRPLYFGIAAMWGFIVGVTGLLAAMYVLGQPVQTSFGVILSLIPISAFALVGGIVIAWAYGEARARAAR